MSKVLCGNSARNPPSTDLKSGS